MSFNFEIRLLPLIVFTLILIIQEIIQTKYDQPKSEAFRDLLTFISFLIIFSIAETKFFIYSLILLFYESVETVSWIYCEGGINKQITTLFNLEMAIKFYHMGIFFFAIAVVYVGCIVYIYTRKSLRISVQNELHIFYFIIFYFLYLFILPSTAFKAYDRLSFHPNESAGFNQALIELASKPIKILKTRTPLKNVLVINIESLEYYTLGCNRQNRTDMLPHICNMWKNSTRITNMTKKQNIFSFKSLVLMQCAIPYETSFEIYDFLARPLKFNVMHKYFPCSFDYFHKAGYDVHVFYQDKSKIERKYKNLISTHTSYTPYREFADTFYDKMLDFLEKRTSKKPFYYLYMLQDTHPPSFDIPPDCPNHVNLTGLPLMWQSYQCMDYYLHKFMEGFKKSKYFDSTEVIIMGDHPNIVYYDVKEFPKKNREFFFMFPNRPNASITHDLNPMDFYPTLLDVAGIEDYEPKTNLGYSFFDNRTRSNNWGTDPDYNALNYIYENMMVKALFKFNWTPEY